MSSIHLVLFDLDDTLFAHRESVEAGIHGYRMALGGSFAAADRDSEFARWNALEEQHYHRYLSGEVDFSEQRRARARGFVEPHGVTLGDDEAVTWFETYLTEYEKSWTLHADVEACLAALAPRQVGIITNGEMGFQSAKMLGIGLDALIPLDAVIASGEVGVAKPDPRIFETAAAHFGVPLTSAMYVGDRLHTDAIGAARAGMTGVWIDRPGSATDAQRAEADAEGVPVIRGLDELAGLLG